MSKSASPMSTGSAVSSNRDIYTCLVTKHSWKGKYKRLFGVGTECISTYNPATLELTNQWKYAEFVSIKPSNKAGAVIGEFIIATRTAKKSDTMKFSSDFTPTIITNVMQNRHKFADHMQPIRMQVEAYKQHWSEQRIPVILCVSEASLNQVNKKGTIIAQYFYKNIVEIVNVSDIAGTFSVVYGTDERRLHTFTTNQRDQLISQCNSTSIENLGIGVKISRQTATLQQCIQSRLGRYGLNDAQITSFVEFQVHKVSPRHEMPVRRLLCISETCLIERDPVTYAVITVRPLMRVHCLVRSLTNPQRFNIEFENDCVRTYDAGMRDTFLASILDGVRAAGNSDVHVKCDAAHRGMRFIPYRQFLDEESESHVCRLLVAPPPNFPHSLMIRRFNSNIPYSGLLYSTTQEGIFTENKERMIVNCIQAVMSESNTVDIPDLEAQLQCLRRLFAAKAGYHAFTNVQGLREKLGEKVVCALRRNNEAINHAALDMLCTLMQPMHQHYELRQEQLNKTALLASEAFLEHLLAVVTHNAKSNTGALVICSLLDFLTFALCAPYSETTSGDRFDTLLNMVASRGRIFYKLFQHPCLTIVKGAGLVMRAIIEESDAETSKKMQSLALSDGAILRHLSVAAFTQSKDVRLLTQRQLSRQLLALWYTDNDDAHQLLERCLPKGLLNYLKSGEQPPVSESDMLLVRNNLPQAQNESTGTTNVVKLQLNEVQRTLDKQMDQLLKHWKLQSSYNIFKKDERNQRPVTLRKRRERVKTENDNWKMLFYAFGRDHSCGDLIWNHKTREELKEALDQEMRLLNLDAEVSANIAIAWNYLEFEVVYPSLADEVRIGDYFLRNLLDEDNNSNNQALIHDPRMFFNDCYHHYLLTRNMEMRCLCLRAMAIAFARHADEIGRFNDLPHLISMLNRCDTPLERDHLILLVSKLVLHRDNVRLLINANGLHVLLDLLPLAHLHTNRAYIAAQQSNIIEAGDSTNEEQKEWYYSTGDGEKSGPIGLNELRQLYKDGVIGDQTKCWASGMESWRSISLVPQLRWTLCKTGEDGAVQQGLWTLSQLSANILKIFVCMCTMFPSRDSEGCVIRPVPRVKRYLSQPINLPHIVQLLLTFDPTIVENCATLLTYVMQDNPHISRLYTTGCFFFILMYAGSNVFPIAQLLFDTHLVQSFRSERTISSVLAPMLPEACIHYLTNHGAEKYAQVFLGEHDNPEVIWNSDMRRYLIGRIAAHIADFSVRLKSNIRAIYQYCPIPEITYSQLEDELFCDIYYLRHLCDTEKFPDWPIKDPVKLLKACFQAWHEEIERKPSEFSVKDACVVLGIEDLQMAEDPSVLRKAYFKLAQKYHPDKNPEGREMFEKVNTAYEMLTSRSSRQKTQGPEPHRIHLCIRAQSIVYSRCMSELEPYKYAAYGQLIKTVRMETDDDTLFSKSAPLLDAATELCYYTLACSALNAEQLRRDDGLEALASAFNRCTSMIGSTSKPHDLATRVCTHCCRCIATAAQFDGCRQRLIGMNMVFEDIVRVLKYKHLVTLCVAAAECVRAMSICVLLQTRLFQSGVLWQLLPSLFEFDHTLGVVDDESKNNQWQLNKLAKVACDACAAMAGYKDDCPENDGVQNSLKALITPYILTCMREEMSSDNILMLLTTNSETPYFLWHNGTREELKSYLEEMQQPHCESELFGAEFKFETYEDELIIGDIFVRLFIQQPSFQLTMPKQFIVDLLEYLSRPNSISCVLGSEAVNSFLQNGHSRDPLYGIEQTKSAMKALTLAIRNNTGVEILCIGHFKMLFAYLDLNSAFPRDDVRALVLEIISLCASNHECVDDIASGTCIFNLLHMLISTKHRASILPILLTLASHGKCVKDALDCGGLVYLLEIFGCDDIVDNRVAAAEVIGKMMADKLTGPRWTRAITQYVPFIFVDACRDAPRTAVSLFDTNTENPELIWNDEARSIVKRALNIERIGLDKNMDSQNTWKAPTTPVYQTEFSESQQYIIGGVYVRVFVQQPTWTLRAPRTFLSELFERMLSELRSKPRNLELLELLTQALSCLLQYQSNLAEQLATLGYLPQLLDVMRSNKNDRGVARACLFTLHFATRSDECVYKLAQIDTIGPLMAAMQLRHDLLHSAAQTLVSLYKVDRHSLVRQAIDAKLIDYLLKLLGSPLSEVENPAAVKAEIVEALKSMTQNPNLGEQIQKQLDASRTWKEFRDQKHDLFLARAPETPALMGATSTVAGYLTAGDNSSPLMAPPPIPTELNDESI